MTENRNLGCICYWKLSFCLRLFILLRESLFRTKGSGDKIIYEAQEMRWRLHISFITEFILHCSSEEQDRSITAYQQILLLLSDSTDWYYLPKAGRHIRPGGKPLQRFCRARPAPTFVRLVHEVEEPLGLRLELGVAVLVGVVEHAQPPVRALQLLLRRLRGAGERAEAPRGRTALSPREEPIGRRDRTDTGLLVHYIR